MNRLTVLAALAALALAGCDGASLSSQARADAQTRAACQARADQTDKQINRDAIFAPPSQVNTPYSNSYLAGQTNRGLSDMFSYDRAVNDCIRNTGTTTDRMQPAGPEK
jgi:hypothetical protein